MIASQDVFAAGQAIRNAKPQDFEAYLAAVRAFTREALIPAEVETERNNVIADQIVQQMRDLGLFGITLPPNYGGLGWDMAQQVRLTMEFTQASIVYRSRFSTTIGLCSQVLLDYGNEDQKAGFLPKMAGGEITAAFCLTEESAGSDASNLKTSAERKDGGYILNGEKRYITNAPIADLYLVVAKTSLDGKDDISVFLVDRCSSGVSATPPYDMMGQRGSHVGGVTFQGVWVPADRLLGGEEGGGLKKSLRGINHARIHVAATAVGQAIRFLDEALAYAEKREQFGKKINEFQAIQIMLADSYAEMMAARAMVIDIAERFDEKPRPHVEIGACKLFATEMVGRVADHVVQIFGGRGYMNDEAVCRMYRDIRLLRLFEGTSQINQINIAKAMISRGSALALAESLASGYRGLT